MTAWQGRLHLLGNADVEGALGEALLEAVHAGAAAHGGVDADHPRVQLGLRQQRVRKEVGVAAHLGEPNMYTAKLGSAEPACFAVSGGCHREGISENNECLTVSLTQQHTAAPAAMHA